MYSSLILNIVLIVFFENILIYNPATKFSAFQIVHESSQLVLIDKPHKLVDHLAAAHVLVVHQLLGVLALLVGRLAEELGESR